MLRSDFFMVTYTATHGQSVLFLVSELASVESAIFIKSVGVARVGFFMGSCYDTQAFCVYKQVMFCFVVTV